MYYSLSTKFKDRLTEGHIWNFWNICKNLILTSHDFGYIWNFTFNTTNFHRYSHFTFITNIATCCIITKISTHGYIWNWLYTPWLYLIKPRCEIPLVAPAHTLAFMNYKKFNLIKLQATVNQHRLFCHVSLGYPGSWGDKSCYCQLMEKKNSIFYSYFL